MLAPLPRPELGQLALVAGDPEVATPGIARIHPGLRLEATEFLPREQRQSYVDRRGVLRPKPAGRAPGASLAWRGGALENHHVAPAASGEVAGDAGTHHPSADHGDRCRRHAVKTCSGCLKLLNSRAFPLRSRTNIVACSPGCPACRLRGSTTKGRPAARVESRSRTKKAK